MNILGTSPCDSGILASSKAGSRGFVFSGASLQLLMLCHSMLGSLITGALKSCIFTTWNPTERENLSPPAPIHLTQGSLWPVPTSESVTTAQPRSHIILG